MATAQLDTLLRHVGRLAAPCGGRQGTDRELLDAFAARSDEGAFAALVARHGPMVLRVCRRVLRQEQDAEDAFQATFLVLARHAGSIRKREALACFLHGVAYRTAMKAKRSAARRRNHEARVRDVAPRTPPGLTWEEVQAGQLEVCGDEKGPIRIRLQAWGTLTGRLVTPDGGPLTDVSVGVAGRAVQPDREGKFRIEGLAAGLKYNLSVVRKSSYILEITSNNARDLMLQPGQTRELGDVLVKPME
jgi:hypothetical protein